MAPLSGLKILVPESRELDLFAAMLETEGATTRTAIAAVGPLVEETLRGFGLNSTIRPSENFHLKPLVRAIIAARPALERKP